MPTTKTPVKGKVPTGNTGRFEPVMHSRDQRVADGTTFRDTVPRQSHAGWKRPAKRRDPMDILKASNRDRLPLSTQRLLSGMPDIGLAIRA